MKAKEYTTVKIKTTTHKKAKHVLSKDPLAPSLCDFMSEAVERLLIEKYPFSRT